MYSQNPSHHRQFILGIVGESVMEWKKDKEKEVKDARSFPWYFFPSTLSARGLFVFSLI